MRRWQEHRAGGSGWHGNVVGVGEGIDEGQGGKKGEEEGRRKKKEEKAKTTYKQTNTAHCKKSSATVSINQTTFFTLEGAKK